jgi:LPXTG-motif cell wall-anchored protein
MLPVVGGIATTVALAGMSAGTAFAADGNESASAYAVRADATLLNSVTAGLPTQGKVVYSKGKGDSRTLLPVDSKPLKAHVLNTSAEKQGGKLTSKAEVLDLDALDGIVKAHLITADCTEDANGEQHGNTQLVDAFAAGVKLSPNNPNSINLLGGTVEVRVNEQIKDSKTGVLTVNALHIIVSGVLHDFARVDMIISQAKCSANEKAGEPLPGDDDNLPIGLPKNPPPTTTSKPATSTPTSVSSSVTAAPSSSTPAAAPKLPNTGANVAWLAGGAVVLLGAGTGALWWTRRRNAASHG